MIRLANTDDIPQIVSLISEFSVELDISCSERSLSCRKASLLVDRGIALGMCFISSESKGLGSSPTISGVVLGQVNTNVWSECTQELNLLALYVSPDYRNSTAGGKLLLAYTKRCEELMAEDNNIKASWIQLQGNTNLSDSSMERLGYRPMDRAFLKES